jgi:uncharacterized protein
MSERHCIDNRKSMTVRAGLRRTEYLQQAHTAAREPFIMKFHLSQAAGNVVTGLGPGWIRIGATEYRENLVLTSEAVATGWAASGFEGLVDSDFAQLLAQKPEVVLFGAGPAIRFPHPGLTRSLTQAGVGIEVMDTAAACRTFNILAAEGRSVVAALLVV